MNMIRNLSKPSALWALTAVVTIAGAGTAGAGPLKLTDKELNGFEYEASSTAKPIDVGDEGLESLGSGDYRISWAAGVTGKVWFLAELDDVDRSSPPDGTFGLRVFNLGGSLWQFSVGIEDPADVPRYVGPVSIPTGGSHDFHFVLGNDELDDVFVKVKSTLSSQSSLEDLVAHFRVANIPDGATTLSDGVATLSDGVTTVPDGGTTVALLGLGLVAVAALRRRALVPTTKF